jgi:hypothetical protein
MNTFETAGAITAPCLYCNQTLSFVGPEHLRDRAAVQVMKAAILAALKDSGELVAGTNVIRGKHMVIR